MFRPPYLSGDFGKFFELIGDKTAQIPLPEYTTRSKERVLAWNSNIFRKSESSNLKTVRKCATFGLWH